MKTGKYKKKKHNSCKIISAACYCCAAFCLSYFVLLAVADYSLPYPGFSYVWPVGGVFFFAVGRFWQKRCRLIEHDIFMPLTRGQKFWNGLFVFILICMCSLSVYELQFILRPYNQPTVDANIRYAIVLEEQLKLLPKGRGVITMTAGYIVIDRMYGSKGTTEAIIAPEEIKNIISFDRKLFYAEMHKTPLLNRKLFTNRGKENLHALVYERKGQRYLCLIAPSATFLEKLTEALSQTQD